MNRSQRLSKRSVRYPDTSVPTTSKTPITASRLAAVTSAIPWSIEAGVRWVPIRPLVEAPQMKKLPARSQKSRERTPSLRPRNALTIGLPVVSGTLSASVAPYARSPRSLGRLRRNIATTGMTASAASPTEIAATRQPRSCAIQPSAGRTMSCPVAPAAEADDDAPEQVELPGRAHDRRQQCTGRDCHQCADCHRANAEAVHQRRGKGSRQAEQDQIDRYRDRDNRPVPAKFVLEGHDQDAGCCPEPRCAHERDEGDCGDDPRVVNTPQNASVMRRGGALIPQ